MSVRTVELSSLVKDQKIGDGGEGEVFSISNRRADVFKSFKSAVSQELDEVGLISTIELMDVMSQSDRNFLSSRTVWPHTVVRDNGKFVGFLMPSLGQEYFCKHGSKGSPMEGMNDWNKLTFRKAWMNNPNLESTAPALWYPTGKNLDQLSDSEKETRGALLKLLQDLAILFEILHKNNVVVGDVSGRNLLWSSKSGADVMLIDCDGCRADKTTGVTRAKQSPEWFDPHLNGVTNISSDLYKLSLAIYRGYFSDSLGSPAANTIPLVSNADVEIHKLALRGIGTSSRPTASEWVSVLSNLVVESENDGRPVIDWRQAPVGQQVNRRPVTPPVVDDDRPNITWQ
jgi:hypothetical protein